MKRGRSKHMNTPLFLWIPAILALVSSNMIPSVTSAITSTAATFENEKTYYSPADPPHATTPRTPSGTHKRASHSHHAGSKSSTPPSRSQGIGSEKCDPNTPPTPPSTGTGGGQPAGYYNSPPSIVTPSPVILTPPSHHHDPSPPLVLSPPPSSSGGGGYYNSPPSIVTPSPVVLTPPSHHHDPSPPLVLSPPPSSSSSSGGYYNSPPSIGTPAPVVLTPPSHHHDPSSPLLSSPPPCSDGGGYYNSPPPSPTSSGGGGYYNSPPSTLTPPVVDSTPPSPSFIPPSMPSPPVGVDPSSPPFTCDYWKSHPALIFGLLGWWGTVGGVFGVAGTGTDIHPTGLGANDMSLQQALSNTRNDGFGALYREGTAALLNSLLLKNSGSRIGSDGSSTHTNTKSTVYPFNTRQVKEAFVAALVSNKAAATQAKIFKLANEDRFRPYKN